MNAIRSTYFITHPLKQDVRPSLTVLGGSLAAAVIVLLLQSVVYASSIPALLDTGQQLWGETLGSMLKTLAIWSVVLGTVFAVRYVTLPAMKYGTDFWEALLTGLPLGVALPFLLMLGGGILIYIPLGLLSLMVTEIFPYATLQFAFLAAAYLVFIWIVVGMVPLLGEVFRQRQFRYKAIAVLLLLMLTLDVLRAGLDALELLLRDSVWRINNVALLLALVGSLFVSLGVVFWQLRGQPRLTMVYAIAGIYLASVASGNFSERLFHWGEIPSAILALLAPLLYVRVAAWILRRDGTALAALVAGFAGLLTGLFIITLLHLGITGKSWISLLYGVIVVLGLGLALGYFLGRRVTRLVATRFQLLPVILRYMDIGLTTGIMAGMFIAGFLAR